MESEGGWSEEKREREKGSVGGRDEKQANAFSHLKSGQLTSSGHNDVIRLNDL